MVSCLLRLLSCVTEHLTAEIVQLTISDITRAIEWIRMYVQLTISEIVQLTSSCLYVRMKKASSSEHALENLFLVCLLFLTAYLKLLVCNQNPENYAIKKGIPGDHLEKHIQGTHDKYT